MVTGLITVNGNQKSAEGQFCRGDQDQECLNLATRVSGEEFLWQDELDPIYWRNVMAPIYWMF